jgi:hypothetical protein
MTIHARLDADGFVIEVQPPHPHGHEFEECFPPETCALFVDAPDEVEIGWKFDGTDWLEPDARSFSEIAWIRNQEPWSAPLTFHVYKAPHREA